MEKLGTSYTNTCFREVDFFSTHRKSVPKVLNLQRFSETESMKIHPSSPLSRVAAALVALAFLAIPVAEARKAPAGNYVGEAKGLKLKEFTGTIKHPNTAMSVRIPNPGGAANLPGGARGRFSGSADVGGNSLGFIFNSRINGRLRTSEIRQGGRKFIISGKWTWRLDRSRLEKRARGKYDMTIKRGFENSQVIWIMDVPIRVGHDGSDPETNYTYSGRFRGVNR